MRKVGGNPERQTQGKRTVDPRANILHKSGNAYIYIGCHGILEFQIDLGSKLDMILRMKSFLSACGMALIL